MDADHHASSPDGPVTLFQTKSDSIADLIQRDVMEGRLLPGMRLLQEEVAARYHSSTTPVREAFRRLESTGLLRRHPHRGHVVASRSSSEIDDIWGVRSLVEGWEAELAAPRMSDRDISELRRLHGAMHAVGSDLTAYLRLNTQFHDHIYRVADRPTLFALSKGMRDPASSVLAQYLEAGGDFATLHREHTAILEACIARDSEALKRATQAHIDRARVRVVDLARRFEAEQEPTASRRAPRRARQAR